MVMVELFSRRPMRAVGLNAHLFGLIPMHDSALVTTREDVGTTSKHSQESGHMPPRYLLEPGLP